DAVDVASSTLKLVNRIRSDERLIVQDGAVHLYLLNRLKRKLAMRMAEEAAGNPQKTLAI
ncbi:MAG: hypothetical protein JOY52_17355, partial [Hyphomicrobiales bacterium]|nr:hypothetical protein [Hyphomicrobiales bacterium]